MPPVDIFKNDFETLTKRCTGGLDGVSRYSEERITESPDSVVTARGARAGWLVANAADHSFGLEPDKVQPLPLCGQPDHREVGLLSRPCCSSLRNRLVWITLRRKNREYA